MAVERVVRDGYALDANGLSDMVKDAQVGFLAAFEGPAGLAAALLSDPANGLEDSQIQLVERQQQFGKNYLEPPALDSYFDLILAGLEDPTIIMLMASAIVSLILELGIAQDYGHGWIEGTAILLTVAVVLNVSAGIDYVKSVEFRKQQEQLENASKVIVQRGGSQKELSPRDVLVGEVLLVQVGDIVCADGVLLSGTDVKIDESALTGEPHLVEKDEHDPFIKSGTNVMVGTGKILVVAVGRNSVQGRILASLQGGAAGEDVAEDQVEMVGGDEESQEAAAKRQAQIAAAAAAAADAGETGSALMVKLDKLAMDIGKAGCVLATIAFAILIVRWSVEEFSDGRKFETDDLETILEYFITAVTILVVAIPEGLPLAVTLSLAITGRNMVQDNNKVKHMDACETMGSATTICSDKTGTLTQNKMTVMRATLGGQAFEPVVGSAVTPEQSLVDLIKAQVQPEFVDMLVTGVALDSAPTTNISPDPAKPGEFKYAGNATECALLKLSTMLGVAPRQVREDPRFADPTGQLDWGIKVFPFSSQRKKMSWVVPHPSGTGFRLFAKGAPSYIYDYSTSALAPDGVSTVPLDRPACEATELAYAKQAMRTLALAYRDFPDVPAGGWEEGAFGGDGADEAASAMKVFKAETNLTLIGIFGIEDPLRPSVVKAIKQCNKAGVDVRMCTGDALETAVAISTQCGILRPHDLVKNEAGDLVPKPDFAMTGAEFDERVHLKDETKPKVKRRCFDPDTGLVGENFAFPFLRDESNDKVLNQEQFDLIWPKLRVLARCQPEDKLTLVCGMRTSQVFKDKDRCLRLGAEHGIKIFPDFQVVAVTGDGTNDAPALKAADVGFAMGIVGTEIAKQACDIMLLDDNFASTVAAVKWGRNVYDSISKFCQFQLTVNISAILAACVGAFAFQESPLTAVQMLWVNMIMDSLASLALATEPPTDVLLERPPYGKGKRLITRVMWFNMIGQAIYQLIVFFLILFSKSFVNDTLCGDDGDCGFYNPNNAHDDDEAGDPTAHWTMLFNTFVLMQLFNEFNSRKLQTVERLRETWHEWNSFEGIFNNPIFCAVVGSTFILQILLVQVSGHFFHVTALTVHQWCWCVGFGLGSLPMQFVVNAVLLATDPFFPPVDGSANDRSRLLDHDSGAANATTRGPNTYALWRQDSEDRLAAKQQTQPGALGSAQPRKVAGRLSTAPQTLALSTSDDAKAAEI